MSACGFFLCTRASPSLLTFVPPQHILALHPFPLVCMSRSFFLSSSIEPFASLTLSCMEQSLFTRRKKERERTKRGARQREKETARKVSKQKRSCLGLFSLLPLLSSLFLRFFGLSRQVCSNSLSSLSSLLFLFFSPTVYLRCFFPSPSEPLLSLSSSSSFLPRRRAPPPFPRLRQPRPGTTGKAHRESPGGHAG